MEMFLFCLVILAANVIQGITGFAGTILAMPFAMQLVGIDVAVPVLNLLGMLSGIYVFAGNYSKTDTKELKKILLVMGISLLIGIVLRGLLSSKAALLYRIFGISVILIAVFGLYRYLKGDTVKAGIIPSEAYLISAGLLHGLFVSGGPLLIAYLTKKTNDKSVFRSTISATWIVLNGIIFITQLFKGSWDAYLWTVLLYTLPFFLAGMAAGSRLYRSLDQRLFMILTYILLIIAGISLIMK